MATSNSALVAAPAVPRRVVHGILAVLPALVAIGLQALLWPVVRPTVWILFYPAVFLATWIGGLRAALVTSLVCSAAALWLFYPATGTATVVPGRYLAAAVFVATSIGVGMLRDRVRAATRRARKANEAYASVVELAPEGIFTADLDGRYTDVNTAGCRMLGATRAEIVGKKIVDLIPASDGERLERHRDELLRGREALEEWLLRKADGTWLPVEVNSKILPDGRWQGFARDISERKRHEDELRQTQERLALALDGADLGMWDWTIATGECIFNAHWAEMRGYRIDEIRHHVDTWIESVHPDDLPHVRRVLEDHVAGRLPTYEVEHRLRTKSGGWVWILGRGKVRRDERGRALRMTGTSLDITERRRFADEQRFLTEVGTILASTLDLEATLASIGHLATRSFADACNLYLVDGGEVQRIRTVARDPSLAWICDAIMGMRFDKSRVTDIWSELEANRSVLTEQVSPALAMAFAVTAEDVRAVRALDPRSCIATPLFAHGKLVGAMAFITTGTHAFTRADLRLAEQIAQRAAYAVDNARLYEAAQRAIAVRDNVLGVVAHDLRNPLGTILLQAALLRRRASDHPAEVIERSGKRMSRIIEDLLEVTRLEQQQLRLALGRVSVREAIADVVEDQRSLATAASLRLELEVPADLPDVCADRDRLLQIFENLLGNAMKFTAAGGVIRVAATARDGEVMFSVADTGRGISPESLPHVFDRFWQASEGGGVGLGLSIVKALVDAHHGTVWVESTSGVGTTVFFTIPLAR